MLLLHHILNTITLCSSDSLSHLQLNWNTVTSLLTKTKRRSHIYYIQLFSIGSSIDFKPFLLTYRDLHGQILYVFKELLTIRGRTLEQPPKRF